MIRFACPACKSVLTAKDTKVGEKVTCPRCGQRLLIPRPAPIRLAVENRTVLGSPLPTAGTNPVPEPDSDLGAPPETSSPPTPGPGPIERAYLRRRFRRKVGCLLLLVLLGSGSLYGGYALLVFALRPPHERDDHRADAGAAKDVPVPRDGPKKGGAPHREELDDNLGGASALRPVPDPGDEKPARPGNGVPAPRPGTIRLSGVHRPGGEAFVASDIELWQVNPVEADTKWKGKVVEVELETQYLQVFNDDDAAGLGTSDDVVTRGIWRPNGWKRVLLLFRGDDRKQLIGFQNLSGNVLVRGKCIGQEDAHSPVVFDDCEIVCNYKPKALKKPPERADKPPEKDKLPAFDVNDFERTVKWAVASIQTVQKEADNGIRYRAAVDKLKEELRAYSGKKVKWSLLVSSIPGDSVVLTGGYTTGKSDGVVASWPLPSVLLSNGTDRLGYRQTLSLAVGNGISKEKAAELRPNQTITITAEVVTAALANTDLSQAVQVIVVVKNLRAE